MKKVAFFFGAGAEGNGNYDIRMGFDYLKSSLYASSALKGFNDGLSAYFSKNKFFRDRVAYRKNTLDATTMVLNNFLIQKSSQSKDFFEKHKEIICSMLSDEERRLIADTLGIDTPSKSISVQDSKGEIKDEFKKILTGKKKRYSEISTPLLMELFEKDDDDNIIFDLNIGIAGTLDSYFHTIIDPYKYSEIRFSRILNYYWACYFTIIRDVLVYLIGHGKNEFTAYLKDNGELNYKMVLQNVEKLTKALYDFDINNLTASDSYYQIIRQYLEQFENQIECCGIITTNYYRFCEMVSPNAIYLNGQLKYFEYPEWLEVADLTKECLDKSRLFFPFIFGQSLVKPIVNPIQTEEFHRLNTVLMDTAGADILVIVGYNINEDDNHINSFLHNYVKMGKKLIVVTNNNKFDVSKKLKCDTSNVFLCKVDYGDNKKVVEKIFDIITSIKD